MIAITSISPSHLNGDHQRNCIQSWINAGYEVHSLNHPDEIKEMKSFYPKVKFFPTHRTHKVMLGKHYVLISAMIDHAKDQEDDYFLLINSDIEIYETSATTDKLKRLSQDGVIVIHRHDYEEDPQYNKRYLQGMDGFFLNRKWLDTYPQSLMCMGQCFWDYWVPYIAITKGIKTFILSDPYLYHKEHNVQYSPAEWARFAEIMMCETGIKNHSHPGKFSDAIYRVIMTNHTQA